MIPLTEANGKNRFAIAHGKGVYRLAAQQTERINAISANPHFVEQWNRIFPNGEEGGDNDPSEANGRQQEENG